MRFRLAAIVTVGIGAPRRFVIMCVWYGSRGQDAGKEWWCVSGGKVVELELRLEKLGADLKRATRLQGGGG